MSDTQQRDPCRPPLTLQCRGCFSNEIWIWCHISKHYNNKWCPREFCCCGSVCVKNKSEENLSLLQEDANIRASRQHLSGSLLNKKRKAGLGGRRIFGVNVTWTTSSVKTDRTIQDTSCLIISKYRERHTCLTSLIYGNKKFTLKLLFCMAVTCPFLRPEHNFCLSSLWMSL